MRNFLIKNIVPILAVGIVGTTLALYVLSGVKYLDVDPNLLRDLRELCFIVCGFYFGSSIGSKEKTDILSKREDK